MGIKVTVTVEPVALETKCDRFGNYVFYAVPAGMATLKFEHGDRGTDKLSGIIVDPGQEISLKTFFLATVNPHIIPTDPCFPVAVCGDNNDPLQVKP